MSKRTTTPRLELLCWSPPGRQYRKRLPKQKSWSNNYPSCKLYSPWTGKYMFPNKSATNLAPCASAPRQKWPTLARHKQRCSTRPTSSGVQNCNRNALRTQRRPTRDYIRSGAKKQYQNHEHDAQHGRRRNQRRKHATPRLLRRPLPPPGLGGRRCHESTMCHRYGLMAGPCLIRPRLGSLQKPRTDAEPTFVVPTRSAKVRILLRY